MVLRTMQSPKNKLVYIPAILALIALVAVAISPISTAIAQESSGDSSENGTDDKAYDGQEGKSCADKKKDRSESTETSGEHA
jgi:hypothetical protein